MSRSMWGDNLVSSTIIKFTDSVDDQTHGELSTNTIHRKIRVPDHLTEYVLSVSELNCLLLSVYYLRRT